MDVSFNCSTGDATNSSCTFTNSQVTEGLISKELESVIVQAISLFNLPIAIVGVITNIINIRVFIEQGVKKDSTNIAFLSLAVFDLLTCATIAPFLICYIYLDNLPKHLTCSAYTLISMAQSHAALQLCSACMTVYMSLVRCLAVTIPLKVKRIITPKITIRTIVIFTVLCITQQLFFAGNLRIEWKPLPEYNVSVPEVIENQFAKDYLPFKSVLTYQVFTAFAFPIVSITTIIMLNKLRKLKQWRDDNKANKGNGNAENNISSKDLELIKSVTVVTCIYIACLTASLIPSLSVVILPGVNFTGVNRSVFIISHILKFTFNIVNASVNFFFYIRISSRYKAAFASSFCAFVKNQD